MTRVLILGAGGMLGHKLVQAMSGQFEVSATFRSHVPSMARQLFEQARIFTGVDVRDGDALVRTVGECRPDVMVNCVGVVKQLAAASDPVETLSTNALLPHRLHRLASATGARLIHISTDCVFSGLKGRYTEADASDAQDLYGRTKFLGEVAGAGALTLRTSIIGRELSSRNGLVEWFLSRRNQTVRGYRRAIFSGLTTIELSSVILRLVNSFPQLSGLYQVSSDPINKFDLLQLMNETFGAGATIEPDDQVVIDRSLDGSRFHAATGWRSPSWPDLVRQLAADRTPYDEMDAAS